MKTSERIFHSLLFEILALVFMTCLAMLVSDKPLTSLGGLAIAMSLIAMSLNYGYNLGFDRIYGEDRINRTFKLRIWHSVGFEFFMILLTLPVVMWVLEVGFIQALILDIGAVLFFLVYTLVFNYAYDYARIWIMKPKASAAT